MLGTLQARKAELLDRAGQIKSEIAAAIDVGDFAKADELTAEQAGLNLRIDATNEGIGREGEREKQRAIAAEEARRAECLNQAKKTAAKLDKAAKKLDTSFQLLEDAQTSLFAGIRELEEQLRNAGEPTSATIYNRMTDRILSATWAHAPEYAQRLNLRRVSGARRVSLRDTLQAILPQSVKG